MTIANAGHDENGKYSGGKAGDQTGGEWYIRTWYDRPWDCVIRFPEAVRKDIAKLARNAAGNDHIGYDQSQRTTFWEALKAAKDYDPENIVKNVETDCSAGVLAIVKAVGYRKGLDKLKAVSADGYTGNERAILKTAGATILTDSKYLKSDKYLLPGDILLNESHHTAINLSTGSAAKKAVVKAVKKSAKKATYTKYRVTASVLNFRKGAGTKYAVTRQRARGKIVYVSKITNGWAKTKRGDWCSVKYLKKVK